MRGSTTDNLQQVAGAVRQIFGTLIPFPHSESQPELYGMIAARLIEQTDNNRPHASLSVAELTATWADSMTEQDGADGWARIPNGSVTELLQLIAGTIGCTPGRVVAPSETNSLQFIVGAALDPAPGSELDQIFGAVPVITSDLTVAGQVGVAFEYTITATNTPSAYYSANLPAGLTRSGAVISGTPSVAGLRLPIIGAVNDGWTGYGVLAIDIAQGVNTITFDALEDKAPDDEPFTVEATATSGLPVAFAIVSGPATIDGDEVTLTGAEGTVVVRASQAGDSNWAAATPVDQSFVVADVLSVTNVEKLSLPIATAVGTDVAVSDGFYVIGDVTGFFFKTGTVMSRDAYAQDILDNDFTVRCEWTGSDYSIYTGDSGQVASGGSDTTAQPWDGDPSGWTTITLTHPALQTLAAASTAQGGVFVAGGILDGLFTPYTDGKYLILGGASADSDQYIDHDSTFFRGEDEIGYTFAILDPNGEGATYYTTAVAATPDLASNWKNASNGTPASITVTSVTAGELAAGFKIGSDTYQASGNEGGRVKFTDVLGIADSVRWNPDVDHGGASAKWEYSLGGAINLGNVAFPFNGTPEVSCLRSDPAAEENWIPV